MANRLEASMQNSLFHFRMYMQGLPVMMHSEDVEKVNITEINTSPCRPADSNIFELACCPGFSPLIATYLIAIVGAVSR